MFANLLCTNPDLIPGIASSLPVGMAWLDHNLILREINPSLLAMLGVSDQDVLGRHCSEVFTQQLTSTAGKHQSSLYLHCVEAIRQEEVLSFVDGFGAELAVETTIIPVNNGQCRESGVIVLMRNITEILNVGKRLKENEDKYQSVVDNIGIGVAVISPEMRILSLNRQMRQWFPLINISLKPVCYHSFNNPPRQGICSYCPTSKTLRDGLVHEAVTETPDGEVIRNYRIISSPIHGEAGEVIAAIEMVEDCTERKRNEQALTQYRNHLEEMVKERTRDLRGMNYELQTEILERQRAEDALSRSSEKIKLFAYSISHDLKSPAIAIEGLCRLLDKRYRHLLDNRGKACCEQIVRAAHQLAELTGKINDYISAGNASLLVEAVNLKSILRDLRTEFDCQLKERAISWIEPEYCPTLMADRLALLRILRNLVDNSLKYGGDRLSEISFGYNSDGDRHLLTVADNGIGLRCEDGERIFDPFHRPSGTRQTEGSGLGLAIVRELAEQHGGGVTATNLPLGGVIFQVTLSVLC